MKKFIFKFISLIIIVSFAFSLVACDDENSNTTNNTNLKNTHENFDDFEARFGEYQDNTVNRSNVSESQTVLYDKNSETICDYQIIISKNDYSSPAELRGANELQYFIEQVSGKKIPIVFDDDADFIANNTVNDALNIDTNKKYFSIGYTSIYNQNKSLFEEDMVKADLGNDGFCVKTVGNTVIMNAVGNNGIIYSVYELLELNLDFEFYAEDVWTITDDAKRNLLNLDVVEVPDFDCRNLDTSPTLSGKNAYIQRLRMHGGQGGGFVDGMESGGWVLGDTSMVTQILKPSIYLTNHPEWYNKVQGNDGSYGQLCFSALLANNLTYDVNTGVAVNQERPFDEFFKNIIKFIVDNPYRRVFMLGINDNPNGFCVCANCLTEVTEITYAGQMCLIANALSDYVAAWQNGSNTLPSGEGELPAELHIDYVNGSQDNSFNADRNIKIAFFAYQKCINAPVDYDAIIDGYKPKPYDAHYKILGGDGETGDGTDNDLLLRNNIVVRVAATETSWMHTCYNEEYNSVAYNAFIQWQTLASNMAVWDYGTNFKDYLSYFPDLHTIQDNFKFYRYCNVTDVLTQLPAHTTGTSFFALKIYLRSKLMWDMDQDANKLVDNFLRAYYGAAYETIKAYLEFVTNYYFMMDADNPYINENGDEIPAKGFVNSNGKRIEFHGPYYDNNISDYEHFPMPVVLKLREYTDEAERLVLADTSNPMQSVHLKHVQTESLWSRYMQLNSFISYYSTNEQIQLINEFEQLATQANLKEHNHACKGDNAGQIARFIKGLRTKTA